MNKEIDNLVKLVSCLPGLGPKSARRIVLYLIKHQEGQMLSLIDNMQKVYTKITKCWIEAFTSSVGLQWWIKIPSGVFADIPSSSGVMATKKYLTLKKQQTFLT